MSTSHSALHAQLVDGLDATQGNAALCVLSLDNLGRIAGEFGIGASELATRAFDDRISSIMRTTDRKLVLAPDRICVVFDELRDPNHTLLVALKIERMFEEPVQLDDTTIKLTPRAGLVYCGDSLERTGVGIDDLYQHAETARELAVQRDTCFQIADPDSVRQARRDWNLDEAVEAALHNHDMTLFYQPLTDLRSGAIVGLEALLRWHRGGELLEPSAFLPKVSELRLGQVAAYGVRLAIKASTELDPIVPVSINLDPSVLRDDGFFDLLEREATIWRVEPSRLCFEVTEAGIVPDYERTAAVLNRFRDAGYRVAIDDFGTGHSSLAHFRALPADSLKIDRTFVADLPRDEASRHITQTVIDLAHRFDKVVVAEGIEDAETADLLLAQGCDLGQGYHFGRPADLAATKVVLAAH